MRVNPLTCNSAKHKNEWNLSPLPQKRLCTVFAMFTHQSASNMSRLPDIFRWNIVYFNFKGMTEFYIYLLDLLTEFDETW